MLKIEELETTECFMVLTVHDEITFCVDRGKIQKYESDIIHTMIDWPNFEVRLSAEGKEWK